MRLLFCSLLSCDGLIGHKESTAAFVEDFGTRGFRGGCDTNKSVMLKEEEEEREENKNNKRNGEKEVVVTNIEEKN